MSFDFTAILGQLGGLVSLAGFIPYIIAVLRGKARPNRASWLIWTMVGCALAGSYYASGARHTIWVPLSNIIGPFIIAVLSLRHGEGGWNKFDKLCLGGAAGSLAVWLLFDAPLIALLSNLFLDFMGALPTIKKSYLEPDGEDKLTWALFVLGDVLNLLAIEKRDFEILIYPVYMILVNGTIAILIWRSLKRKTVVCAIE